MNRRSGLVWLLGVALVFPWYGLLEASEESPPTRLIRDRAGREVRIPETPKRIACLYGPSYEKLFALGAADRVVAVANTVLPWAYQLNPELKRIPVMTNFTSPDVEQLLALKTDLVLYHPFVKQIESLSASGLPVAVPYDGSKRPLTLDSFFIDYYEQIRSYGELLGGRSKEIAEEYCRYAEERMARVRARTEAIPAEKRPKVFYVCGRIDGPSGTQSRFTTAYWLVEAAGGTMLTHEDSAYFISVTTEQLLAWNPDIIVVSTEPTVDSITRDSRLQELRAVKEHKVFLSPQGIFYWSHFSTESFLCILFMAKLFHPDLFADVDVLLELKAYYERFYHYTLTDDEAKRILNHLPPQS